jgi:hypothetical protein
MLDNTLLAKIRNSNLDMLDLGDEVTVRDYPKRTNPSR